ncbi:MAG: exo-alpha-sialidase [Planctomycetes bacterium]|nr:exo-alpha-sialidase [Planctomycetota bacterium]
MLFSRSVSSCSLLVATFWFLVAVSGATAATTSTEDQSPITIHDDGNIVVRVGESREVMNGVQPFLYGAADGVLLVQSQLSVKPYGKRRRITHFPWRVGNRISRDFGEHWEDVVIRPGEDHPFLEGGGLQQSDGTILMLDTYITPTNNPDEGEGDLWISRNTWRTFEGPAPVRFRIPDVDFDATSDDGGHPHRAMRLHRSLLELPNGDLLVTAYGCFKEDRIPSSYQPKMMKLRSVLFRSRDGGISWDLVSTIAVGDVGSEGFCEPALCRLSRGPHLGRLFCLMRTGRDLYQAVSDDEGATWSAARPVALPGIDIHDTANWRKFVNTDDAWVRRYPVAAGAVVDPDLVELKSGILACAVGVRIPEKACFRDPACPRNGNYLAFSRDGGETWSHVVQLTSGVWTTHYMGIREIRPDHLYVTYDLGFWGRPDNQVMGCTVDISVP